MCGRYTLISNVEAIRALFKVSAFDERLVVPRYNIAPTQPIVVVRNGPLGRELLPMRWGLIPWWAKDPRALPLLIMARADGVETKPAFRDAFRYRRCLIPASGFYEWQARGKGPRQPFAIRPQEGDLIALAGLWETWHGADGSEIDTAAVVTTTANDALSPIHERMPVVLRREDFDTWLSSSTDPSAALALLKPAANDLLSATAISTRVNSVENDDAGLWRPIDETAPPPCEAEAAPQQMRLI